MIAHVAEISRVPGASFCCDATKDVVRLNDHSGNVVEIGGFTVEKNLPNNLKAKVALQQLLIYFSRVRYLSCLTVKVYRSIAA